MRRFEDDRLYRTSDPYLETIATRGTMAQWRHRREGPPFVKFGHRVLYRGVDLNEWIDAHVVTTESTQSSRIKRDTGASRDRAG